MLLAVMIIQSYLREVAAHTSQAKPLFVRNRRCVILWRTGQFLVFLTFHYTDRSAEPHFSSLIIGVWVQVRAHFNSMVRFSTNFQRKRATGISPERPNPKGNVSKRRRPLSKIHTDSTQSQDLFAKKYNLFAIYRPQL